MTYIYDNSIKFGDSESLTAFSRARIAEARLLGDYRYMYSGGTSIQMNDKTSGAGNITPDFNRNCVLMNVGTANGDFAIRQTKMYHPYISGTSNIAYLTFTPNQPKQNVTQCVGLFDDYNGIFFRINGAVPQFVIRKSSNYSTVSEQTVNITEWNLERFDGSFSEYNKSGITIDFTKSQILVVDYQWLGVGRVRIGFVIDGVIYYGHQFNHSNKVNEVYMHQPSLPCRWEIRNTGIASSNSQLMAICGAVYCEGSDSETGFDRSVSVDGTSISLTSLNSANGYGVLAIRLKNSLDGKPNRSIARLKDFHLITDNDVEYKIVILPNKSYLANANSSWTSVPGYGWCEYIKGFSLSPTWEANNDFLVVYDGFNTGSQGNKTGAVSVVGVTNQTSSIYQNYDSTDSQILAVIGYKITVDVSVRAALNWIEIK